MHDAAGHGGSPCVEDQIRGMIARRLRLAGLITLPFIAVYSIADVVMRPSVAAILLALKTIPLAACGVVIAAPMMPWLRERIVPTGIAATIALGITGCVSSVVESDVGSLPILLTSLGMTSAVYLPWGPLAQGIVATGLFGLAVVAMALVLGAGGMIGSSGIGSAFGMFIVLGNSPVVAWMIRSLILRSAANDESRERISRNLQRKLEEANRKLERRGLALEEALEEAEKANISKSRFLANISHELRTPLTSVVGFAAMLRNGAAGAVNPKQLDYASEISRSAEHLLRLVEGILSHARIEANEDPLQLSDVPLDLLVEVACRQVTPAALERSLTIQRSQPTGAHLVADRQKLLQVMLNLLSNAIKFTPEGGEIGTEVNDLGDTVEIVIWDRGIGLRPDDLERIFRPFEQIPEANRTSQKGAGLGLPITRRLVELHGGSVRGQSEPGRGSRFVVTLPKNGPGTGTSMAVPAANLS